MLENEGMPEVDSTLERGRVDEAEHEDEHVRLREGERYQDLLEAISAPWRQGLVGLGGEPKGEGHGLVEVITLMVGSGSPRCHSGFSAHVFTKLALLSKRLG